MSADEELTSVFRAEVEEQLDLLVRLLWGDPGQWELEQLFRIAHNVKGAARVVGIESVRDAAHALEEVFAALRRGASRSGGLPDAARRGCELLSLCFTSLEEGDEAPDVTSYRDSIAPLLGEGSTAQPTQPAQPTQKGAASTADSSRRTPPASAQKSGGRSPETLRLNIAKLEALMSLTGDIATAAQRTEGLRDQAARLDILVEELARRMPVLRHDDAFKSTLRAARSLSDHLARHSTSTKRLSTSLVDGIRSLRLVPVDNLRLPLNRALQEASRLADREVELVIDGGDTEIDRGILDALRDPLIHLIRNAVAHGIEGPAERQVANKPPRGTIRLAVRSMGSWVQIDVEDDGRGLDVEQLRQVALNRGMVAADGDLTEDQLLALVFEPGFTSVEVGDEVSGRGVGLDVVKRRMEEIGGGATVESRPGAGARFRLRVPLTRLTTKGLLVRVGGQIFLLPMHFVERTLLVEESAFRVADGRVVITVDDRPLPALALEEPLRLAANSRDTRPGIVLNDGGRRRVYLVDEVIGDQDVVIQPLCWNVRRLEPLSGCTILKGEQVVPVLDASVLLGATGSGQRALDSAAVSKPRRRRILIVDDSVTSRTLVSNILASAGYDVRVAIDGEAAWEDLGEQPTDLVISDVDMPALDGIELTRRIRKSPGLNELPIILVTSLGDEEHRQRGADAGADAYIVKGAFDQDELLKAVSRLL